MKIAGIPGAGVNSLEDLHVLSVWICQFACKASGRAQKTSRTFFVCKNTRVGGAKDPSSPECLVEHLAKVAFAMMEILFVAEFPSEAGWNFWLQLAFFATDFPPDPAEFRPGFATPDGKAAPVPSKVEGWNAAWVEPRSKWGSHEPSKRVT